jgi:hypothetical protein
MVEHLFPGFGVQAGRAGDDTVKVKNDCLAFLPEPLVFHVFTDW